MHVGKLKCMHGAFGHPALHATQTRLKLLEIKMYVKMYDAESMLVSGTSKRVNMIIINLSDNS